MRFVASRQAVSCRLYNGYVRLRKAPHVLRCYRYSTASCRLLSRALGEISSRIVFRLTRKMFLYWEMCHGDSWYKGLQSVKIPRKIKLSSYPKHKTKKSPTCEWRAIYEKCPTKNVWLNMEHWACSKSNIWNSKLIMKKFDSTQEL